MVVTVMLHWAVVVQVSLLVPQNCSASSTKWPQCVSWYTFGVVCDHSH